jgi:outer membrane protein OmpA-like peptidoglycan-associated protein
LTAPHSTRALRALHSAAFLAALLIATLPAGCATQPGVVTPPPPPPAARVVPPRDDLFVVLPGPDGKVGAVTVTHDNDRQVLDGPYTGARIRERGRLQVARVPEAEVREVFGDTLVALPPRPASFTLFFTFNRDELTDESREAFRQISLEIARRPAVEVIVTGHTDRVGTLEHNDALSLQRAARVRRELGEAGVPADRIEIAGRGEREPLVPTDDEVPEPRNRRVEITVR